MEKLAHRQLKYVVKSIGRAMPRTETRGRHPNCVIERCRNLAEFTFEIGSDKGAGYLDLCSIHLAEELKDSTFAAKVLAGVLHLLLPKPSI
jgi:hypothetical protein